MLVIEMKKEDVEKTVVYLENITQRLSKDESKSTMPCPDEVLFLQEKISAAAANNLSTPRPRSSEEERRGEVERQINKGAPRSEASHLEGLYHRLHESRHLVHSEVDFIQEIFFQTAKSRRCSSPLSRQNRHLPQVSPRQSRLRLLADVAAFAVGGIEEKISPQIKFFCHSKNAKTTKRRQ